ncbi:phage/plasmid primase, P4 family [Eubacteriaceae bacterium ES3]|nr:phage/plasmid primase, P4 family [Eubacteriaceae bacterium ES3]
MDVSAQEILQSLLNPEDSVCFRIFDDRKEGTFTGQKLSVECGKYQSIEAILKQHNKMNRGIFFVVNTGGHDDGSITRINAQFVECDELSFEEQQKQIEEFSLPPSMIIKTKKSLHTYWFIKDSNVSVFRGIQKQLVKQFRGDPMCINESRVMRLPGFYHCKGDPVMVTCVAFHPERRYTQAQLSAALPAIKEEKIETKNGSEKGLNIVLKECNFIKHCRENATTLSEHDWYAMVTNLAVFKDGTSQIHKMSKPHPDYSVQNTQKKINHFLESGTRPITCQTIADKGFKCPRMLNGDCQCKAPAALCYLPMSLDGLRSSIANLPVKNAVVDDIQTARIFVEDYLYNQDSVTAETIINYEIKAHFGLKNTDLKPLIILYKNLNKEYTGGLKARKNRVEMEFPSWYEPTERGLKFLPGVLAEHMSITEKVFYAAEQYYLYQNGVYREMPELEAQKMVREKMISREVKMNQITDAERQWRLLVQKDIRELNANPFIINVKNGLYNVIDDTLTDHAPDYYSTVQLNVSYDPKATCPRFVKYLHEVLDKNQIPLIQEMIGYFLVPITRAQKCFVIVGTGGSGKSQLLLVLNEILLGSHNVSNVAWQALNERFKTAELFGKLANIFADLPTKNIDDNGIFKALVGEDYLTVEKKNKNPFSFQSTARLLFSCNSIPRNYGDKSEGFYRRLIIVRFDHAVPENSKDPELLDKLQLEADGIFLFALEGLKRLINNHYRFSETNVNKEELQQYREESNSVLSFVKECCLVEVSREVGSTELFNAYKGYCEECGLKPFSQKAFVRQLLDTIPGTERGVDSLGKRRIIKGIILGEILG